MSDQPTTTEAGAQLPAINTATIVALKFEDTRQQLVALKQLNESEVFDYDTKTGNKDARSHVAKLRKVKAVIEGARKDAKADALDYGRKVDAAASTLKGEVDEMIDIHWKPLQAIKEKDDRRASNMTRLSSLGYKCTGKSSEQIIGYRAELSEIDPEGFKDVEDAKADGLLFLDDGAKRQKKVEDDAVELAKLQREKAEREAEEERQAEIQRLADQQATREAEAAKLREKIAEQKAAAAEKRAEEAEKRATEAEKLVSTPLAPSTPPPAQVAAELAETPVIAAKPAQAAEKPCALVEMITEAHESMAAVYGSYVAAGSQSALNHPKVKRLKASMEALGQFVKDNQNA